MPIVLQNTKAKGRFIKYTSIGGITKSVFVDAFSEYLVPEVDTTDALVNKVDRARISRSEERLNENTLSSFLFRTNIKSLKTVTETARWQRKVVEINSNKQGFLMVKDGRKHAFSVNSLGDLAVIGSTIFDTARYPVKVLDRYDGDYMYAENTLTITSGLLSHINGSAGADTYSLDNNIGNTTYTVFVAGGESIFGNDTTIYQNEGLSTLYNLTATLKYDVAGSDTNKKITFSSGVVTGSADFTMEAKTYYLSGSTGSSYTHYNEVGEDVYDISDTTYLYSDDQGFSPLAASRTILTVEPWKYLSYVAGRIVAVGNINVPAPSAVAYTFKQGRVNTTVYVVGGLQVGSDVFTDVGLTTALANGDYVYASATITIASGAITRII